MNTYWGSGDIAVLILSFDITWRSMASVTSRPLYPWGKSSWHPFH